MSVGLLLLLFCVVCLFCVASLLHCWYLSIRTELTYPKWRFPCRTQANMPASNCLNRDKARESYILHHHLHLSFNLTSTLHSSLFSIALWDLTNSRPVLSLMLSSHLFFCLPCLRPPLHCALHDGFGQTWWTEDISIPLQFASLYDGQEVYVWPDCLLGLGTDFLIVTWSLYVMCSISR